MKRYHLNKKEILYWANKARRFLKLPPIDIELEKRHLIGESPRFYFHIELIKIVIGQVRNGLIIESYNKEKYGLSNKESLVFAIFHEMAHYFQFLKHRGWLEKYRVGYVNNTFSYYSHNQQKLEVNANKIAYILYKKLYLNSLDTE